MQIGYKYKEFPKICPCTRHKGLWGREGIS